MSEYKHLCPVCRQYYFESEFVDCPICGWINDEYQEDFPKLRSANVFSLEQAIEDYKKYGKTDN